MLNFNHRLGLRANKLSINQHIIFEKDDIPQKRYTVRKNKDVFKALKLFAGKDDLRPVMKGFFVDKDAYIVTDAHKLLVYKTKTDKNDVGKILNAFTKYPKTDDKYIDGTYPNYKDVIPTYTKFSKCFTLQDLYNDFNAFVTLSKPLQTPVKSVLLHDDFIVDYFKLTSILKSLLMLGSQKVKFAFSDAERVLLIQTDDNHKVLLMPISKRSKYEGAFLNYTILLDSDKNNSSGLTGSCSLCDLVKKKRK